jgi:hypothetical protein
MKAKKILIAAITVTFALSAATVSNAQKKRKVPKAKKAAVSQKGNLSIEAGIIFDSGQVNPVARAEFYLLKASAEEVIQASSNGQTALENITLDLNFPIFKSGGVSRAMTAIEPYIVSSIITSFQGKATFQPVKTGNYYLFGFTKAGKSAVVWNLQIPIKGGTNSIILDNNNAALVSDR